MELLCVAKLSVGFGTGVIGIDADADADADADVGSWLGLLVDAVALLLLHLFDVVRCCVVCGCYLFVCCLLLCVLPL